MDAIGIQDIAFRGSSKYSVQREYPGDESIIDIKIHKKEGFLIYIENKNEAPEGLEQCDREYRDMQLFGCSYSIKPENQKAVFLTPDGQKPEGEKSEEWIRLSYKRLADAFERILCNISSNKVRNYVRDWIAVAGEL